MAPIVTGQYIDNFGQLMTLIQNPATTFTIVRDTTTGIDYHVSISTLLNGVQQNVIARLTPNDAGEYPPGGANYVANQSVHFTGPPHSGVYLAGENVAAGVAPPASPWVLLSKDGVTPDTSTFATQTQVSSAISTHAAAADPHAIYLTQTEAAALFSPIGGDAQGGLRYNFVVTTGTATTGQIRFNNATVASVTSISIHESDRNSAAQSEILDVVAVGTRIQVSLEDNEEIYAWFRVSGAVVDNGSDRTIPVAFVSSAGTFAAGEVTINFLQIQGPSSGGGATGLKFTLNTAAGTPAVGEIRSSDLAAGGTIAINPTDTQASASDVLERIKDGAIMHFGKDGDNWVRGTVTTAWTAGSGSFAIGSVVVEGAIANSDTVYLSIVSDAAIPGPAGSGSTIRIREVDGTPNELCAEIVLPNGSASISGGVATFFFDVGLTASRTYYIRTDGNDSNNGLANTAGGAFLTIQRFFAEVASLKLNGFTVTGQLVDGIFSLGSSGIEALPGIGAGEVILTGNATNNTLTTIRNTADQANWAVQGIIYSIKPSATTITVRNLTLDNTATSGTVNGIFVRYGALLQHQNINFGNFTIAGGNTNHISVTDEGLVRGLSAYQISGGANRHWNVTGGANLRHNNSVITLSNSPAFTIFANATNKALMSVQGNTFSGTAATGQRYTVNNLSEIFALGGPNYFPGNAAGSADAATFGLYL